MAENDKHVQHAIPKFAGHYDHWAKLMETFLRSKQYWNLVEHGITKVVDEATPLEEEVKLVKEHKLKDLKIMNYLYQAIDCEVLDTILNDETSKDIWDSMKQKFQGSTRVKRAQLQALRREFEILQMKKGEIVNLYFARTLKIAKRMKACGEHMDESVITTKILSSMISKFNYAVCSIEETNNLEIMTIDELQSSLFVHDDEENVLHITNEDKGGRGRGRGRHFIRDGQGRGRGRQPFNKANIECFKCHKLGHFQYECPTWQNANYVEAEVQDEIKEEDELLLMAYVDHKQGKEENWFPDSRCSNHMSANEE
ncbi:uncharacterized protein LOC124822641 [Vigna umbellata]|uniref:uncharacterized protein LOC124822641 n=1 Tax=Vigna umbellata TaxID=87088 RepID=UPI001F5F5B82|nr:uncharacterized protein LOC124822641 [Vigna umbellata]